MLFRRSFIKGALGLLLAPLALVGKPERATGGLIPSGDYIPALHTPSESVLVDEKYRKLYMSPQALEDIRNWGIEQVDEETRREIYSGTLDDKSLKSLFNVSLSTIG